jgi:hypothetical protein
MYAAAASIDVQVHFPCTCKTVRNSVGTGANPYTVQTARYRYLAEKSVKGKTECPEALTGSDPP